MEGQVGRSADRESRGGPAPADAHTRARPSSRRGLPVAKTRTAGPASVQASGATKPRMAMAWKPPGMKASTSGSPNRHVRSTRQQQQYLRVEGGQAARGATGGVITPQRWKGRQGRAAIASVACTTEVHDARLFGGAGQPPPPASGRAGCGAVRPAGSSGPVLTAHMAYSATSASGCSATDPGSGGGPSWW